MLPQDAIPSGPIPPDHLLASPMPAAAAFLPPVPDPVSHLDARALEWPPLLGLLAQYAVSSVARDWLLALSPSTRLDWIDHQHQLTEEVRSLLAAGFSIPLNGLFDPSGMLQKAQIPGAALDPADLQSIARLAHDIASWQSLLEEQRPSPGATPGSTRTGASGWGVAPDLGGWDSANPASAPPGSALHDLSQNLAGNLRSLADSIDRKILPDGTLADDASPELRRIRAEQDRQQRVIEEGLRAALRRLSDSGQTQADLITIRGERFVIPVKVEQKRRVQGVVHGASSSGQTVYIEPLETIEQNNLLVQLLEEEQAEIHRIFVALTHQVASRAESLLLGAQVLAVVDTAHARARFANDFQAIRPQFSPEKLSLANARHPLLEKRLRGQASRESDSVGGNLAVSAAGPASETGDGSNQPGALHGEAVARRTRSAIVPLSLELTSQNRQLIVSGPNTGGKTVTLKTAALLALMAQSGIPVPASAASLPILHAFLADIGDSQSIEQALSTFSAHIVNLDRLSRLAGPQSLVLLDELGSSTDPAEGAALAVAIADHFRRAGAWTIITTHHTALKVYASTTTGVINAAAGFDERTLAPNYQLRLGVPGASAGIQTAERLGLNPEITTQARARLGTQAADIGRFLDQLQAQINDLEAERKAARAEQYALNLERARLAKEGEAETRQKIRSLETAMANQLNAILKDFQSQLREAVNAITDSAAQLQLSKEAERRLARLHREFQQSFQTTVSAYKAPTLPAAPDSSSANLAEQIAALAPGDQIRLKSIQQPARILRQIDPKTLEVAVGAAKMRVQTSAIVEVLSSKALKSLQSMGKPLSPSETALAHANRQKNIRITVQSNDAYSDAMKMELNLIGKTVDEATAELEKYLDHAFLSGLPRVRIIHGHGSGILRRNLREFLKSHPHVAQITEPPQNEGGQGATIVDLRQ